MIIHSAMPLRTFDLRGEVCYEGALERCCLVVGRLRPDIVKDAEQPPAVTYIGHYGLSLSSANAISEAGVRKALGDGLLLRLGSRGLGDKPDSHGPDDSKDGCKLRVAILAERLVKTLSGHASGLRDLAHALCSGDEIERVTDFGGIAIGENNIQILRTRLRCAKVFGGVELLQFADFHPQSSNVSAISLGFRMSLFWVRLSPPQSRMTTTLPRRV